MLYGDLPSTIGTGKPQPQMTCVNEDCERFLVLFSAERGDYFMARDDTPVECSCGGAMHLATETRTITIRGEVQ